MTSNTASGEKMARVALTSAALEICSAALTNAAGSLGATPVGWLRSGARSGLLVMLEVDMDAPWVDAGFSDVCTEKARHCGWCIREEGRGHRSHPRPAPAAPDNRWQPERP